MSFERLTSTWDVVPVEEALERHGPSATLGTPHPGFTRGRQVRLHRGNLSVLGDLAPDPASAALPYDVVVDGDLTVEGDVDWWDEAGSGLFLVTGDLRARNLLLSGRPRFVVAGDLAVSGRVQGHHGDDAGRLVVGGRTQAQLVVNTGGFTMVFGSRPEAVIAADPGRTSCPVDVPDSGLAALVLPALLDGREVDEHRISSALRAGEPVLRPGVRPGGVLTGRRRADGASPVDEAALLDEGAPLDGGTPVGRGAGVAEREPLALL
ncbi:hypothetical protein [Streptomyces sp. NRRL S-87]|uniref:hypothetical protein n=1 Tax=Streptomyces sp. NRRL S-87 TaxID=1463920 RepID=UPI0004C08C3A|nr:hypothetical protein [Streptomyces sp. NRRL S-87]